MAERQSESLEPPVEDWPHVMPVPEGNTAAGVEAVEEEDDVVDDIDGGFVEEGTQPGMGVQFGSVEPYGRTQTLQPVVTVCAAGWVAVDELAGPEVVNVVVLAFAALLREQIPLT